MKNKIKTNQKFIFALIPLLAIFAFGYFYIYLLNNKNPYQYLDRYFEMTAGQIALLPKYDRPDLAELQNFIMTKDPKLGFPPVERKISAYEKLKLDIKSQRRAANNLNDDIQWVERGPNNVAGRTRAIMFDPNDEEGKKVWSGGVNGGLWYNNDITDSESSWIAVDDFMANLGISSIASDPNNTSVFYISTGNGWFEGMTVVGGGIWKSENGGQSWNRLASTANNPSFAYIQKIVVTPNSTILAATRSFGGGSDGIYRSTNGGETWQRVVDGRGADIEVASNGIIYASTGIFSPGVMYKSGDDGLTWSIITPKSNAERIEIAVSESNPNVVYAIASFNTNVAWFEKSTDGGNTWSSVSIPRYLESDCSVSTSDFTRGQAWFDLILGVHPENENLVIVGGIDLHRTTDGGNSWSIISYWTGFCSLPYVHADLHAIQFRPGFPNEMIVGSDGGINYSKDIRTVVRPTFVTLNKNYNITTFYAVAAANEINSNYYLAGAQDNGTQQFRNPGINETREATGGDGGFCFIDQEDSDIQITSYVYNSWRRSIDGGRTFVNISNDQNKGRFINPADYDSRTKILYAASSSNELAIHRGLDQSTAPAIEYRPVALSGQASAITVSPHTSNRLFVGTNTGRVTIVSNANTGSPTVQDISSSLPNAYISNIQVGQNENQLIVVFSNYGVNSLYYTTNGGQTWTSKEGNLPDIPVRWALINPYNNEQVLIATDLGVWATNNFTAANVNWEPAVSGLANVRCDMLKYRESDGKVVVATMGRGIFTSDIFSTIVDADFYASNPVTYEGSTVHFNSTSLGASSHHWDFGDGSISEEKNPIHIYSSAGNYDVTLTINGNVIETKANFIKVLPLIVGGLTAADGGDFENDSDLFASAAIAGDINIWQRGVPTGVLNQASSGTQVWKTNLSTPITNADYKCGLYTPAFDISDPNKKYTIKFKRSANIRFCNAPAALQVQYSTDGGLNWKLLGRSGDQLGKEWYNKSPENSCLMYHKIFMNQEGWMDGGTTSFILGRQTEYNVSFLGGNNKVAFRFALAVVGGFSANAYNESDGFAIDDFEFIEEPAGADFISSKNVAYSGTQLNFYYTSGGATQFLWEFGDGTSSSLANPIHSYSQPGDYTVRLTVNGNVVEEKMDFIRILTEKPAKYLAADGGNFEVDNGDFGVLEISGTSWQRGNSTVQGKNGTKSGSFAYVTGPSENHYENNSESYLFTPKFNLNRIGNYLLEFYTNYDVEPDWEGFTVEYSINDGNTWIRLGDQVQNNWYNTTTVSNSVAFPASSPIFSGSTGGNWERKFINIGFLFGQKVAFRFVFKTDGEAVFPGVAIDDFAIIGPDESPLVAGFSVNQSEICAGSVIEFTNTSTGTASTIAWDFGLGATPRTASGLGPHLIQYIEEGEFDVKLFIDGNIVKEETEFIKVSDAFTVAVTVDNNQLIATEGEMYSWFLNDELLAEQTNRSIIVETPGSYKVEVTRGYCSVLSSVFEASAKFILGTEDLKEDNLKLYPNPTEGRFMIVINNAAEGTCAEIYDLSGKIVATTSLQSGQNQLDVSNQPKGIYVIKVANGNNIQYFKLVKAQ